MKHKGIDYKTSAVQYYLNNNESMDKVCKIFNCKKTTLKVWVYNYKNNKNLTRRNRKPISYGTTTKKTEYTRKPSTRKYKLKLYKDVYIKMYKIE